MSNTYVKSSTYLSNDKMLAIAIFISLLLHVLAFGNLKLFQKAPDLSLKHHVSVNFKSTPKVTFKNTNEKNVNVLDNVKNLVNNVVNKPNTDNLTKATDKNDSIITPSKSIKEKSINDNVKKSAKPELTSTNIFNEKPNDHIEVSESTKDYRYSQYFDDWKKKIEKIGSMNYPAEVINATLVLKVVLKSDGSLISTKIVKSSGNPIADEAAIDTVKFGAPYARFPDNIKNEHEYMDITKTWTFYKNKVTTS